MRKINYIAVHCTATAQNATIETLQKYWRENLGWIAPGYHHIVTADGEVVKLLEHGNVSNGVHGYNAHTINVCYFGGVDSLNKPIDNRTPKQRKALLVILRQLKEQYPDAIIQGHKDFPNVAKACPCFDAKTEYKEL